MILIGLSELLVPADSSWLVEMVPSGHCDRVVFPAAAGELEGLAAAASGPNRKVCSQALALAIVLAASKSIGISPEALHNPGSLK